MCGIAGVLRLTDARPISRERLVEMTTKLAHRGPDDAGTWVSGPVGLGHRRLSILDIAGGHQPWLSGDGRRALVYNGELYNFEEIKTEEGRERFRTTCDTEVLMHLAAAEDSSWLHRLNGMFAFAHWDDRRQELLLARDRVGIKPLFYALHAGNFYFASEIKSLLAAGVPARVNEAAVPEYLAFHTLCGDATLYEGILSLPPGHTLRIRPGMAAPVIERFWDSLPAAPGRWTDPGLTPAEQFAALFRSAVQYRLIADVPLGTYNSGGVDSSLVSARVRELTDGVLHTFSVGFEEDTHDESRYAQIVADRLGTTHHVLIINSREYADGLETALGFADQPMFQPHTVQLMKLSALAKQFVTVVLTGEGADELFAGYPRYQIPLLARRLAVLPGVLNGALLAASRSLRFRRLVKLFELGGDPERSIVENSRRSPEPDLRAVGLGAARYPARQELLRAARDKRLSPLEEVLEFDRWSYLPGLLHRLDFTTMANGVEARVPFLDYRLVEWSMAQPASVKMAVGRRNKILVKDLAAEIFPREMIYRRKVGFGVPVGEWLRQPAGLGRFLDVLTDGTFARRGYCDAAGVADVVARHRRGERDYGDVLWGLINLELWCQATVDRGGGASEAL